MADELTIEADAGTGNGTRRVTRNRERAMSEENQSPIAAVENAPENGGTSAEDAIEKMRKIADEKAAEASRERQGRLAAENTAKQERDARAREQKARASDRHAAVAAAKEAAASDKKAAMSALKTARDAGDFDAEMQANDMLSSANYRLHQATGELAEIDAKEAGASEILPENRGTGSGGGDNGSGSQYTPEEQAWIAKHPKFGADAEFTNAAAAAARHAMGEGAARGSPAYFRYIDAAIQKFEDNGGNTVDETPNGNGVGRRTPASSGGAPPSRSNGNGSGSQTIRTALGTVTFSRRSDGKLAAQIPADRRADWDEAAKINNMSLNDYIAEQYDIAQERAAGGDAGLVTQEGALYR